MKRVDGLTFEQVKYNIYAFAHGVKKFERKVKAARKTHTLKKWIMKRDEAIHTLENNVRRMQEFIGDEL